MAVLRRICGITRKDRKRNIDTMNAFYIDEEVVELLQKRTLTLSGPLRADPWPDCILVRYGSRVDRHRPIADPIRGRRALVHSNLVQ